MESQQTSLQHCTHHHVSAGLRLVISKAILIENGAQASGLDDYEGGSGEGRDACDRSDVLSDWSSVEGYAIAHGEVPCGDGIHEELSV